MWNVGLSINHLIVGQLGLKVNVSAIDSGTPPTKIVVYGQTVLQKSSVLVITMLSLYDGVSKLALSLQTAVYESSLRVEHGWRESLYRHPGWLESF